MDDEAVSFCSDIDSDAIAVNSTRMPPSKRNGDCATDVEAFRSDNENGSSAASSAEGRGGDNGRCEEGDDGDGDC